MIKLKSHIEWNKRNQSYVIQSQVLRVFHNSNRQQSRSKGFEEVNQEINSKQQRQQQHREYKQTTMNSKNSNSEFKGAFVARSQESNNVSAQSSLKKNILTKDQQANMFDRRVNTQNGENIKLNGGSKLQRQELDNNKQYSQQTKNLPRSLIAGASLTFCLLLLKLQLLCIAQTQALQQDLTGSNSTLSPEITTTFKSVLNDPELNPDLSETTTLTNNANNNNNTINKLKPVNFTLVDEIFEAVLSEEEVVKKWKFMDSQLQDGMKSILKMIFPQIVSISQDAKVSGDCSGGILKWILSLRNLRSWAIKMLDATGKPTSGIFQGSLTMFGNYRQCLSIRAPDEDEIEITDQFEEYFRGQFCVVHLKPWMPIKKPFYNLNSTIDSLLRKNYKYYEKTLYDELAEIAIAFNFIDIRMDLCVPSTCTVADIQRVAELLSKKLEMRAKVMRCDTASRETSVFNQLDRTIYTWLLIPLMLIISSFTATILIAFKNGPLKSKRQNSSCNARKCRTNQVEINQFKRGQVYKNKFTALLHCLSIKEAIRDRLSSPSKLSRHLNADDDDYGEDVHDHVGSDSANDNQSGPNRSFPINLLNKPLPLYGLRTAFIFWFIIVQMTMELKYQYLRESLTLRNMIVSYWPFQIIVNSTLLFESIIIITAFTYSYTCLESSLKELVIYIFGKYVRLVFSIITLVALTVVTPLMAIESPVWRNFVEEQASICKSTGYINIFFLQNFIPYEKICLPHTWLFCVELQLILLSVPLMLLFKNTFLSTEDWLVLKKTRDEKNENNSVCMINVYFNRIICSQTGALCSLFIALGTLINFFAVYTNQLPPSWFYTFPDNAQKNYYFGQYLTKTWTHLSAFMIGLISGHICRSAIQLRHLSPNKIDEIGQQNFPQQASPASSSSTNQSQFGASRQSHGSTSAIVAMELSSQTTDDGTSSDSRSIGRSIRRRNQMIKVLLQVLAATVMLVIIFSTFSWSTKEGPSTLVAALYDSTSRLVWSLSLVCFMIQLCSPDFDSNKYSPVAKFLAHPVLTLMGRLSFLAYLITPYVHTFALAVEEQSLFPSLYLVFHFIVGNIVITYVLSFILSIVIEQPIRRIISQFVFGKRICKQKFNISTYCVDSNGSIPTISLPNKP